MSDEPVPPVDVDVESIELEAVIIRADGTREDLGVVAEYRKPNTVKRALWRMSRRK